MDASRPPKKDPKMVPVIASRREPQKVNFCFYLLHFGHVAGVPKIDISDHISGTSVLTATGDVQRTTFAEKVTKCTPKWDPEIDRFGHPK